MSMFGFALISAVIRFPADSAYFWQGPGSSEAIRLPQAVFSTLARSADFESQATNFSPCGSRHLAMNSLIRPTTITLLKFLG